MSNKHSTDMAYIETLLQSEVIEDVEQMARLDEIDSYLDSEAHILVEQEMFSEYEAGHGSADGFEDMLAGKLAENVADEESMDIGMYNRIQNRIEQVADPEARRKLYAKYAPEIMKGRQRSMRLVARAQRKIAKARALDAKRVAVHLNRIKTSLRPKPVKDKEREHPGRVKDLDTGYPVS